MVISVLYYLWSFFQGWGEEGANKLLMRRGRSKQIPADPHTTDNNLIFYQLTTPLLLKNKLSTPYSNNKKKAYSPILLAPFCRRWARSSPTWRYTHSKLCKWGKVHLAILVGISKNTNWMAASSKGNTRWTSPWWRHFVDRTLVVATWHDTSVARWGCGPRQYLMHSWAQVNFMVPWFLGLMKIYVLI